METAVGLGAAVAVAVGKGGEVGASNSEGLLGSEHPNSASDKMVKANPSLRLAYLLYSIDYLQGSNPNQCAREAGDAR